jgi:hypothetical protein
MHYFPFEFLINSIMPSMNLPGLSGTRYVGYFAENGIDPTWFATASADKSEVRTNWYNALSGLNGYSWEYTGFFVPQLSGDYSFVGTTDDATVMWLGSAAVAGNFDTTNFLFSADASSFNTVATPVTLSAGIAYPIRIQWGHPIEPTVAILGLAYQHYSEDRGGYSSVYSIWDNVTYHTVPYTIDWIQQPTSKSAPRGALVTLTALASASNNAPLSYNWFLSSSESFFGDNTLNITQFLESPDNDPMQDSSQFNQFVKSLTRSVFNSNTNTLLLRNTDNTVLNGISLSDFEFFSIAFAAPERTPKWQSIGDADDYLGNPFNLAVDSYPNRSASASVSVSSTPVYPQASPYYSLLAGTTRPLSAYPSEDPTTLFFDITNFPGVVGFAELVLTESLSTTFINFTNNPNIAGTGTNVIVWCLNTAEGYGVGNQDEYFYTTLVEVASGSISFTQNSNTATYNFNNAEDSGFFYDSSPFGSVPGGVQGLMSTQAVTLVSPSPVNFNSFDPITISSGPYIDSLDPVAQRDAKYATATESGAKRFRRLLALGYV